MKDLMTMRMSSLSSLREEKEMIMIVMRKVGNILANRRNLSRNSNLLKLQKLQRELLQESLFKKVRGFKLSTSVNMLICPTKNHHPLLSKKLRWLNHWPLNTDSLRKIGSSTGKHR